METMNNRERQRHSANKEELVDRISAALPSSGRDEVMPGLLLARSSEPNERLYGVTRPSFCVIAQGAKEVYLGESVYRYDADRFLIATVELPIVARVVEASLAKPYLSLRLDLDSALVSSLMIESGLSSPPSSSPASAISVSDLDAELLDATVRLVRLLDSPSDARILSASIKREIVFRLLQGEQSERIKHIPMLSSQSNQIAKAVHLLRKEFTKPMSMETLARELGMSSSGFHHHFKAVTNMSPLQFQKQLRLQEARRLMLSESLDASNAGYRVGYDNPSHFSRDYKKHFGNAPIRDVETLRGRVLV